jgi:hypothetical protein
VARPLARISVAGASTFRTLARMGVPFDDVHFTECFLSQPRFEDGDLVMDVRQVYVPRADDPQKDEARSGVMRFRGVARSERTLYPYKGGAKSGQGFESPQTSIDIDVAGDGPVTDYRFGGVHLEPVAAWVEWRVHARDFELTLD